MGQTGIPKATYLMQNYPNPFNPNTTIKFGIANASKVSLRIYDVSGRLVRVLIESNYIPNHYALKWDGKNDKGHFVSIGTQILVGPPLESLPFHRDHRFPRSMHKPVSRSRRFHTGRRLDSKQVPSRLIPG
jgi:hypothetical protein